MKIRFVIAWLATLGNFACTKITSFGNDGSSSVTQPRQKKSEVLSNQDKDSAKPSEDSEGIPGYLVDPDMISAAKSESQIEFKGKSGSVKSLIGKVEDLPLTIWSIQKENVPDIKSSPDKPRDINADYIKTIYPNPNGSFSTSVSALPPETWLAVSTASPADGEVLKYRPLESGYTTVLKLIKSNDPPAAETPPTVAGANNRPKPKPKPKKEQEDD